MKLEGSGVSTQLLANAQNVARNTGRNAACNARFSACNTATRLQRCIAVQLARRRSATRRGPPYGVGGPSRCNDAVSVAGFQIKHAKTRAQVFAEIGAP